MGREAESVRLGIGFGLLPLLLLARPACGAGGGRRLQPRVEVQGHRGQVAARRAWAGGEVGVDAELPSLPAGLLLLLLQPGRFLRAGQVQLRLHLRQQVAVQQRGDLGRLRVHDPVRAEVRIAPVELEQLALQGLQPFELPRGAGGRTRVGGRSRGEGRIGHGRGERAERGPSAWRAREAGWRCPDRSTRVPAAPGRAGRPRRPVRSRLDRARAGETGFGAGASGTPGAPRNRRVSNMDRRALREQVSDSGLGSR